MNTRTTILGAKTTVNSSMSVGLSSFSIEVCLASCLDRRFWGKPQGKFLCAFGDVIDTISSDLCDPKEWVMRVQILVEELCFLCSNCVCVCMLSSMHLRETTSSDSYSNDLLCCFFTLVFSSVYFLVVFVVLLVVTIIDWNMSLDSRGIIRRVTVGETVGKGTSRRKRQ